MPRRQSNGEDFLDILLWIFMRTPWWVSAASTIVVFTTLYWITPLFIKEGDMFKPMLVMISHGAAWILGFLFLFAGALAEIKKRGNRHRLDSQRGLDTIRAMSWRDFELLVGEAYRRKGYSVEITGQGGADGGVDLILRWKGGTAVVQCKQWREQQVGVSIVRELFGVMGHMGAQQGIIATCGTFTPDAYAFAEGKPIELMDGRVLAKLVGEVRVSKQAPTYEGSTNGNDSRNPVAEETEAPNCPVCGRVMGLKTARKGSNAGSQFWGCPAYPKCRGTRNI